MTDKNLSDEFAPKAALVPMVVERSSQGERAYDIFSRLLKDHIVFVAGPVTMESSLLVVAQLLHLASDPKTKDKGIDMYIMSPGGEVLSGNAIIDTMNHLKNQGIEIRTTAMGLAMSMGSAILVNGTPGQRRCLPSTSIMLHQPSGGAQGKVDDMVNRIGEAEYLKRSMAELYKKTTKMDEATINRILNSVDSYMQGEEALKLGVVDEVVYPTNLPEIAGMLKEMNDLHADMRAARLRKSSDIFAPK